jgi:DUF1680 family protein
VRVEQESAYPFDGNVTLRIVPERSASFTVHVRIPQWAEGATVRVNDAPVTASGAAGGATSDASLRAASTRAPGGLPSGVYFPLERSWRAGDTVTLQLPMQARTHRRTNRNVQESQAPDGFPVSQEVLHFDYLALSRGPLVYATDLIDGFKFEETLRLDADANDTWLETVLPASEERGADLLLRPEGRAPLTFQPYYRAGGRRDRTWRLTWMTLPPE